MSTAPRFDGIPPAGGAGSSSFAKVSEHEPILPVAAVSSPKRSAAELTRMLRTALGLAIIVGCFLAGEFAKRRLGLILPGSVLGLFLLLALLGARVVRIEWVEEAARRLLMLLPLFFVPIYTYAAEDRAFWREWGLVIAGTLALTVTLLWIFVGRLAQRWLGRTGGRKAP
jgi:holin-like protein